MNYHDLADQIIVWVFFACVAQGVLKFVILVVEAAWEWHLRGKRSRLHKRWVAARVAAREATQAKCRAEDRWDNYAIQDAMDAAGDRVMREAGARGDSLNRPFGRVTFRRSRRSARR